MTSTSALHNQSVYTSARTARACARDVALFAAETAILDRFMPSLIGGPILDIGIGAGRTSGHLAQLGRPYLGVDYSQVMVAKARQQYPSLEFRVMDARTLAGISPESQAFVMFSYNGIDSLDHPGRLQVLASVRRALKTGGLFAFSSHNRLALAKAGARGPVWRGLKPAEPISAAREIVQFVRSSLNARRLRSREISCAEYEIVNDEAYNHSLLNYYIAPPDQAQQLNETGFALVAALDVDGKTFDVTHRHNKTPMVHYVCQLA